VPEGPSIVILREQASAFVGRVIRRTTGNAKIDMQRLPGRRVIAVRSFGKQFLVELSDELSVRIHLLMFGSYRIDEERDIAPRLGLGFDEGEMNFYNCSVRLLEGALDTLYDWRGKRCDPRDRRGGRRCALRQWRADRADGTAPGRRDAERRVRGCVDHAADRGLHQPYRKTGQGHPPGNRLVVQQTADCRNLAGATQGDPAELERAGVMSDAGVHQPQGVSRWQRPWRS
jgi:hypothetical protein